MSTPMQSVVALAALAAGTAHAVEVKYMLWDSNQLPAYQQCAADFQKKNPGITINLATRLSFFDFRFEPMDAAIHFGQAIWPGAEMMFLRSEVVVPACSPDIKRRYEFAKPDDLKKIPLLHISTRANAWEHWFSINGGQPGGMHRMVFDPFATAAQATIAGVGAALLPEFLIQEELASGKLVQALNLPMERAEGYYLVWPIARAAHPTS